MANFSDKRGHMPKGKKLGKRDYYPRPNAKGTDRKGQPWSTDLKTGLDGRAYGQSDEDKKAKKAAYERERYQRNREVILKQQKGYYNDNQQGIRDKRQAYQDDYNSRVTTKDNKDQWQRDNPDKVAKYNKTWKEKKRNEKKGN